MDYAIIQRGESRSFPDGDAFLSGGSSAAEASVLVYLGGSHATDESKAAVLIELGTECLGEHTGEHLGGEGSNVLGFARSRTGSDAPSKLIELVRQPNTLASAVDAARKVFETAGFSVAVCGDQAGRIVDRLVRPKYNAALRLLDEGLATQADIDLTCRLGLGYADGPVERVVRGGLAYHHDVTRTLFDTYGAAGYAPARRAVVAANRARSAR